MASVTKASWRSPTSASKRSPASSRSTRPILTCSSARSTQSDDTAAYAACLRLISIHDVLTVRDQYSDPTASRLHPDQESEERDRESSEPPASVYVKPVGVRDSRTIR